MTDWVDPAAKLHALLDEWMSLAASKSHGTPSGEQVWDSVLGLPEDASIIWSAKRMRSVIGLVEFVHAAVERGAETDQRWYAFKRGLSPIAAFVLGSYTRYVPARDLTLPEQFGEVLPVAMLTLNSIAINLSSQARYQNVPTQETIGELRLKVRDLQREFLDAGLDPVVSGFVFDLLGDLEEALLAYSQFGIDPLRACMSSVFGEIVLHSNTDDRFKAATESHGGLFTSLAAFVTFMASIVGISADGLTTLDHIQPKQLTPPSVSIVVNDNDEIKVTETNIIVIEDSVSN